MKKVIESILKDFSQTRDNDNLLVFHVLIRLGFAHKGHKSIKINLENFEDMPSFETITRIRREIQNNEQRLKPSQEVEEKRNQNRQRIKSYFSTKSTKAESFPNSNLSW